MLFLKVLVEVAFLDVWCVIHAGMRGLVGIFQIQLFGEALETLQSELVQNGNLSPTVQERLLSGFAADNVRAVMVVGGYNPGGKPHIVVLNCVSPLTAFT